MGSKKILVHTTHATNPSNKILDLGFVEKILLQVGRLLGFV